MGNKVLIALDQGTTSSRAVVFSTDGQMLAAYGQEFPQIYPKPGWVEHDPADILNTQINTLKEAVRVSGVDVADICFSKKAGLYTLFLLLNDKCCS